MKGFKIGAAAKKAILIGSLCSISYLAVYIARNTLGAVSAQMESGGVLSIESIGVLSAIYFACYAVGQLINGAVGDKIKAKYMISLGLILAGICNAVFPAVSDNLYAVYAVYGISGFFLSMVYGPMTKLVAENTEPVYATRCSIGYSFASFIGSPLAGVLASLFPWGGVFVTAGVTLLVMGAIVFVSFSALEQRGHIQYGKYTSKKGALSREGISSLLKHRIVKFTFISILTGVIRTTVVSLLTLYFAEHLGYTPEGAAGAFTIATLAISFTTFIAIFVYERLGRNMDLTILLSFALSTVFFLCVYLINDPIANIVFIVLAIMASNSAATMLWSRYCPSLYETGMVSTATGFLDFVSYMAAALSSTLFTGLVKDIGWGNVILICTVLMLAGALIALPYHKLKRSK